MMGFHRFDKFMAAVLMSVGLVSFLFYLGTTEQVFGFSGIMLFMMGTLGAIIKMLEQLNEQQKERDD